MEKTLHVLNRLEHEGLLRRYAIGGAVAALYYIDPFDTEDLDVMLLLADEKKRSLAPLADIYAALRDWGFTEDGPFVMIEGVPVQFLVAYNALVELAVANARDVQFGNVPCRVLSPEYLTAIMIQTGRAKDRARFEMMREQSAFDRGVLEAILAEFDLLKTYRAWTK